MTSTITERQRINTSSAVKVPCKAATTANITLSGEQTIDGVSCVTNDRVLVKDQTDATENGIYVVNTSSWSRARDWDGAYDVKNGTFVYVTGGTSSGFWYVTTSDPIIPGTTSVTIAQASSQLLTFSAFIQTLLDDASLAALLASMGFSTDMQAFLQTANDAAALTALGAAADADVVHKTGNETVEGNKTLSGDNDIKDTLEIYDPADNTKKVRIDAGSVSTATTRVVTVPDRDITLADPLTSGTAIATTSGTSHDFTSIPSWVKRITLMFSDISTNGSSIPMVQIGDSGGIETTGYSGEGHTSSATGDAGTLNSSGFLLMGENSAAGASTFSGNAFLCLIDPSTNTWVFSWSSGKGNQAFGLHGGGSKSLSGTLDRVRFTTVNGTDTFDAGKFNVFYE